MRILFLRSVVDVPERYNYHINYGVWDAIEGDSDTVEHFKSDLNEYDCVFLPMYSRWNGHMDTLNRIKHHKIKKVLFDNDSCYRLFVDRFYEGIDYIFYRCADRLGGVPENGSFLRWSVDGDLYKPGYGHRGIAFNCYVSKMYPLRKEITGIIERTKHTGARYRNLLTNSGAAIHTNSEVSPVVRAKAIEYAATGTEIISNRMDFSKYFPENMITFFDTVEDLEGIIRDYRPDIERQKALRMLFEEMHTNKIRAKEILKKCV